MLATWSACSGATSDESRHRPSFWPGGSSDFQCGILRVDLGLRLRNGRARLEARNQMLGISAGMPLLGTTIFRARREREV